MYLCTTNMHYTRTVLLFVLVIANSISLIYVYLHVDDSIRISLSLAFLHFILYSKFFYF